VTPLQGLRDYLGPGARVVFDAGTDLARARGIARDADAVIVVAGLDFTDEGESIPEKAAGERGGDRRSLALHAADQRLILAAAEESRRVVVVLVGGSVLTMEEWKARVPAIVMAWYPGMEGGRALARVLFGDVNPSGKLTVTVPGDPSWLPPFDPGAKTVEYGYYHGYTLAEKKGIEPAFPFGYGLSYTRFRYSGLRLSTPRIAAAGSVDVSVDVSNVGSRPGEEVVELYAGFPHPAVDRPVKLLRGFEKVGLSAGETRTVRFALRAADLAYYDAVSHSWRIEPTDYTVLVGGSSRAADLQSVGLRVGETRATARP
jgi:beta-glucosidase